MPERGWGVELLVFMVADWRWWLRTEGWWLRTEGWWLRTEGWILLAFFLFRAKRAGSLLVHIGNITSSKKQRDFTLTSAVRFSCFPTQSLHSHVVAVVPHGLWKTTWNFRTCWKSGILHILSTKTTVLLMPNFFRTAISSCVKLKTVVDTYT